jgi:Ca2+-binding EF-hand superfamily protein
MSASRAAYEAVQKKTFTNWANVHLRRKGESMLIDDLYVDLADGTRLCSLFEVLTGQTIKHRKRKKIKKATHKLHSCENINQAIHFVEAQGIRLVNMDASFIYEGRPNIILGLMWTSILNFQVADIDLDGLTGKRGLLEWAKRACKAQGVKVSNFTTSWNNGRALCALIANFRGDLLTMAAVGPKSEAMSNTQKALDIGSQSLDIPIVMDAEDLCVAKPDEKSVVTMVAEWFKAFAGQMKSAAYLRAVVNAVNLTRAHDDFISQFEEKVADNSAWAEERSEAAANRAHGGSTDEVKTKLDEFYAYKGSDKVGRNADLQHTENILLSLRTSQANSGRPTYEAPSEDQSIEALKSRFEALDTCEDEYAQSMLSTLKRFVKMDRSLDSIVMRAQKLSKWMDNALEHFESPTSVDSIASCEAALAAHSAYAIEHAAATRTLDGMEELASTLSPDYTASTVANEAVEESKQSMEKVNAASEAYKKMLEQKLKEERALLSEQGEYARLADDFLNVLDGVDTDANAPVYDTTSIPAIEERLAVIIDLLSADGRITELETKLSDEVEPAFDSLVKSERANSFLPRHHKTSIKSEVADVKARAKARRKELEDALNTSKAAAEGLYAESTREYDDVAKALNNWINDSIATFSDLDHGTTVDDTAAKLAEYSAWDAVKPEKRAKLDNLQFILQKVNESQRHNKLPELVPGVGLDPDSMKGQWKKMETAGADYKSSLQDTDVNFNKWQRDADLFNTKAEKLEPWLTESLATFKEGKLGDSIGETETLLANHDFYNRKLDRTQNMMDKMQDLSDNVQSPFHEAEAAKARMEALKNDLSEAERLGKEYEDALKKQLEKEKRLKDLMDTYANDAEQLIFDIETCGETIDDPLLADSIPLLEAKSDEMNALELEALAEKMAALEALAEEMEGFGRPTDELWLDRHAIDNLREKHAANKLAADARQRELADLLAQQQEEIVRIKEQGIDEYKGSVSDFHEWVNASLEKFSSPSLASIIKQADVDGDGDLSYAEFEAAMKASPLDLRTEFGTNSDETKEKLNELTVWENKEKPPRYVELEGLSTTLAKVNATLRLHEMDVFTPDVNLNPETAQEAWKNLELQTMAYKLAVQQQHLEFLKMDHAAAAFNEKNSKLNTWADAKLEVFGAPLDLPSNARAEIDDDDDEPVTFVWKWESGGHDSGATGGEDQEFVAYDAETMESLEEAYDNGDAEATIEIGGKTYKVTNLQGHGDGVRMQVQQSTGYERHVKRVPDGAYEDEGGDTFAPMSGASARPSAMVSRSKSARRSSLAQLAAAGDASLGQAQNVSAGGGMRRSSVMPIRDTTAITKVKMDVAEMESKLGGLRTYKMQLGRFKHMCDDMAGIAETIKAPYVGAEQVGVDLTTAQAKLAKVEDAAATFEQTLQEKIAEEQELLKKGREFDTMAAGFLGEVESTMSEINAPVNNDTAEVEAQLSVLNNIVDDRIPTVLEKIPALNKSFLQLANTPDRSDLWQQSHHIDNLNESANNLQECAEARRGELEEKLDAEREKDRLREEFAEKAQEMVQFVADTLNAAKNFARGDNLDGIDLDLDDDEETDGVLDAFPEKAEVMDLKKRIGAINQLLRPLVDEQTEELDALREIDDRCAEANAQDNPFIDENMTSVQLRWDELLKTLEDVEGSLKSQIEAWNDAGLSDEQKKEIAKLFRQFGGGDDVEDGEHALSSDGFFDAATAMAIPLESKEQADKDFARYCSGADEMDLPTFVKYIEDNITASATKEDVLKCFQDIAGDPKYITEDDIAKSFTTHGFDLVQYIVSNMEEEEDGQLNFKKFTKDIFKR